MNILLGQEQVQHLGDRYTVLTLDTFSIAGRQDPVPSFCVIDSVPISELADIGTFRDLHENLMKNYAHRNWNFCEQAIEHLMGRWNRELDSFYVDLLNRVQQFKIEEPGDDWSPILAR